MLLLRRIDDWARNRLSRVVKTSKLQFIDSGLWAALMELTFDLLQQVRTRFDNVLETSWSGSRLLNVNVMAGSQGVCTSVLYQLQRLATPNYT